MACFLVPAAEAIVTTVAARIVGKNEEKKLELAGEETLIERESEYKVPFSRKLKWLSNLLWGGSALLAFEHVWHGEVIASFPFLSGAADPVSASAMLHEMATAGVGMAVLVTAVWGGILAVVSAKEKKAAKNAAAGEGI
ncbi:MAG: hypothetical protein IIZ45_03265 [Firmicutes bacterium]|nr:hypothetical protein [Bacillota bacterium]